jgi:hypothetical protein
LEAFFSSSSALALEADAFFFSSASSFLADGDFFFEGDLAVDRCFAAASPPPEALFLFRLERAMILKPGFFQISLLVGGWW